ncbi:MAG: hypothetical protein ACI4W6_00545 [Acutalibacteraceae bacterium]
MEELLGKLIEIDKNARKRVAKAKKANTRVLEEIENKKQELKAGGEEKFSKELEKEKEKQSAILKDASKKIDADCRKTVSQMDNLFATEGEKWIQKIVSAVTES